jgi:predicted small metal-binding protein
MERSFACKDIGMACGFQARAESDSELLPKIGAHAKSVHGIDPIPADLMARVQAAIRTA